MGPLLFLLIGVLLILLLIRGIRRANRRTLNVARNLNGTDWFQQASTSTLYWWEARCQYAAMHFRSQGGRQAADDCALFVEHARTARATRAR